MTIDQLTTELKSTTCRCGKPKESGKTFCYRCYTPLPPAICKMLHRLMGEGYEEGYEAAGVFLDARVKRVGRGA